MENKTYYITTSIPYVNASPHLGFGLEYIQTDAFGRYYRKKYGEDNVRTQTGSDENSLKNVQAAEKAGEDVSAFVERHAEEFKKLEDILGCEYTDFIRTREERHIKGAQKLWASCKSEDIYKKSYKGLYCVGCESFYTEKDCPDGICPIHKKPLDVIEEENYFFRLSNYQQQLKKLISEDKIKIYPETRKNEMLAFIDAGLEDFSISRSQERARHWGVPVPGDDSQVMYVWFDALSNYITALGYADDSDQYTKFWVNNNRRVHILGKDITRFHAIYWPAMLLSASVSLPTEMYVHGFFTVEGEKMSKSIGNVIHPKDFVEEYGVDAVRYFLLREMPYASDGDISKERVEIRYAELANQLGNLVSRIAAMAHKYFDGTLNTVESDWSKEYAELDQAISIYNLKEYLDIIFSVVNRANDLVDKTEPYKLVKTDEKAAKDVLSEIADMIRFIGDTLEPVLPTTAKEIQKRYNGDVIQMGESLFPRRDKS